MVCVFSGRTEDSGVVSTANYEARNFGVTSGVPIRTAKRYLAEVPGCTFLPMDRDLYVGTSEKVMAIARDFGEPFEQTGLDECYFEITDRVGKDYEGSEVLAGSLKGRVRGEIGLTLSLGIAPNKLLAKMVSSIHKPDGLKILKSEEIPGFLSPLPIGKLPGVGKKMDQQMDGLGINSIGDLREMKHQDLVPIFGNHLAEYFYNASRGMDSDPVKERGKAGQIGRIVTLKEDSNDMAYLQESLERVSGDVHMQCEKRGITFRTVTVTLITAGMETHSRSRTLGARSTSREEILDTGLDLTQSFLRENPETMLRRIGIRLSGFDEDDNQISLTQFMD